MIFDGAIEPKEYKMGPGDVLGYRSWTSNDAQQIMICPESALRYREVEPGIVRCLDLDEDSPLPDHLAVGKLAYGSFKR